MRLYAAGVPDLTRAEGLLFAYGSLVAGARDGVPAVLRGHRRAWTVAMDNRQVVPGYKRYRDPRDGAFPPVHVAFLDVVPDPDGAVTGLCLPVTAAQLRTLDARERNYDRVDVTARVDGSRGARVWTYRGSADGRARAAAGHAGGTLVVVRAYLEAVRAALQARGGDALVAPPCPVVELQRVDLPPAEPGRRSGT